METLSGLWLPILISAILAFAASSLIWMVLGYHKTDWKGLPDEPGALEALGKQSLTPGQYVFPYAKDPAAMKEPAFVEKMKKGPVGQIVVRPSGVFNMGKTLSLWFVYLLLVSAAVAFVTAQALPMGAAYMRVFRVAGGVAIAAYVLGNVPKSIWWGYTWSSTVKEIVDGIVYGLLTAGTFGWLWPR
jgi:hypothetical protein